MTAGTGWVVRLPAGPLAPSDAVTACRIAAAGDPVSGYHRRVLSALADGIGATEAGEELVSVPDEAVNAALEAVARYWKGSRSALQQYPSRSLTRVMLEAAAPLIVAAEREQIRRLAADSQATCIAQGGVEIPFADLLGDDPSDPEVPGNG